MTTKLATLRTRLNTLRGGRALVRYGTAWSALGVTVLWVLLAAFLIDWAFEMDRWQRLVSLLLIGGTCYWAFRKLTKPFLGKRETLLDMAILVEREQEIDSDLVAAIQFESDESARWGSRALEDAVIDYVADFGSMLNVFKGFSRKQLLRRAGTFAATLVILGGICAAYPAHASAFFNRLLLGSQHYPTKTRIERIAINGVEVFPKSSGPLKVAFGRPLRFEVACTGEIPEAGRADLTTRQNRFETTVALEPAKSAKGPTLFRGELPRLVDAVRYQLYLGDAWTDAATLDVIPLPIVEVVLNTTPPPYAQSVATIEPEGARQISVIEGSRVDIQVTCGNKALKSAVVEIGEEQFPLSKLDGEKEIWTLASSAPPLIHVLEPVRYQIQVTDIDELKLEQPIQGLIRLKPDRSPRIGVAVISRKVLPSARPKIRYDARDDFGIAKVRLLRTLMREDGTMEEYSEDIDVPKSHPTELRGRQYPLELSPLKLAKGDQLKITLEVLDYRGELPGKTALSEPLVLQVTDVQGFLAAMVETDEQSARQLDAIIQRQLGIGESQ